MARSNREILAYINREKDIRRTVAEYRHILLGILFFILTLFLFGCSAKEQVIYKQSVQEVFIPVKCNIVMPVKPQSTGDVVKDNINLIAYLKDTERTLKACVKGE